MHSWLSPPKQLTCKDWTLILTSGLFTRADSNLTWAPSDGKKPKCSYSLRGWRRKVRGGRKILLKTDCHLPPPPGGRTNRGQSGWESKQKCVSLAPASKKPDPRAPETEPEDKALGGGRVGEGNQLCRFQILPCPALPCLQAPVCHVTANKQHGKACQERWQGCLWG